MADPYAPPGESSFDLYGERALLDGLFLGSIAYGVHLTLFIWCFRLLLQRSKKTRMDWFYMILISLLFALGNVGNATNIKVAEDSFINKRNYPGGPNGFYAAGGGVFNLTCNVVYIINLWFQDGLLVGFCPFLPLIGFLMRACQLWRFWMFFARGGRWYVAIIPGLMFLTTLGISLALIITLCAPGNTLWSKISVELAVPYWAISIALNVTITTCIVAKLLYMRNEIRKIVGGGNEYVSVTSMLVESAALYTSNGLIFLVSYAVNSPVQNLAAPVLGQMQCIAPMLIILRVLRGHAWSSATFTKFETESTGRRHDIRIPETSYDSGPTLVSQSVEIKVQTITK